MWIDKEGKGVDQYHPWPVRNQVKLVEGNSKDWRLKKENTEWRIWEYKCMVTFTRRKGAALSLVS